MRKVHRPSDPPAFLLSSHVAREKQQLLKYLRRDPGQRRERRDRLNDDIFYDHELRASLERVFLSKCAFCESTVGSRGNTHHLRPLRHARSGTSVEKDYYLWLAFEWRNLFYACPYCQKSKGELFPVRGARSPYLATFDDVVEQEDALVLDPTAVNPDRHLRFLHDGQCRALTPEGLTTLEVFDLNRRNLVSTRRGLMSDVAGTLRQSKGKAPEIVAALSPMLTQQAPHVGALVDFLKRVAASWRPMDAPIPGRGDAFVRNFLAACGRIDSSQRKGLWAAIDNTLEADLRFKGQDAELAASLATEQVSLRARAFFPAGDREISRISISNFKAIDQLSFELPPSRLAKSGTPCLMLLGENSTGKSSVLSALALALIGRKEAAKYRKLMPKLVRSLDTDRFDQLDGQPVEVSVGFHFSEHSAHFAYDPVRHTIEGGGDASTIVLGYGPRRFFNPRQRSHAEGAAARVRTLFDPLATIPYPGDWLLAQTGYRHDAVASALRVVLALNDDDELLIGPDRISVRANRRVTPIEALSEGYRSVFVMTVDIIREVLEHWDNLEQAQAVVLIDELETHLHPRWKMQVMTSLRRVLPRVQFIVTTHDPLCLRGMDDHEVEVLQRDENDLIRRLEGLPSVRSMTAEQLLTSDYFGLSSTADPSTELELARLAGDAVRRDEPGSFMITPSRATSELVNRLVIGDSPSEQIVQDALQTYLERREAHDGELRPELRAEAVEAVIRALRADQG